MSTRNAAAVADDQLTVVLSEAAAALVELYCGCLRGGACDTQCGATKAGRVTAIPVASPGFSARTMPATATEAAELLRSDRRPSTVNGASATMTPLRRSRH